MQVCLIFIVLVFLIVNISLFNAYKNSYTQKILYLHKMLDKSNLKTFSIDKKFEASIEFMGYQTPGIRDDLLENHDYFLAITKFRWWSKVSKRIKIALISVLVVAIISLLINR